MSSPVPKCSGEEGNTNTSSPKKGWCFTINNFTQEDINDIIKFQNEYFYIYGKETGASGTHHLQGYLHFHKKVRFSQVKAIINKAHIEPRKGTKEQAVQYCQKDGDYYTNNKEWQKKKTIPIPEIYGWQLEIDEIVQHPPHARKIHWRWENTGNFGKSTMIKYLCLKYGAICLSGKAGDMKYGILKYYERKKEYPSIICIDIPRSIDIDYLSYTGIEEIKNGCYFNTKYESEMVIMNTPHIIIFANEEPNIDKLSSDRWDIKNLRNL